MCTCAYVRIFTYTHLTIYIIPMCVYMRTGVYRCAFVHIHVCKCIYRSIYAFVYICLPTYPTTCLSIRLSVYVCMRSCVYTLERIDTFIRMYVYEYLYVYLRRRSAVRYAHYIIFI